MIVFFYFRDIKMKWSQHFKFPMVRMQKKLSLLSVKLGLQRGPQSWDITFKCLQRSFMLQMNTPKLSSMKWLNYGLKVSYYQIPTQLEPPDCVSSEEMSESKDQMKSLRSAVSHQCPPGFAGNTQARERRCWRRGIQARGTSTEVQSACSNRISLVSVTGNRLLTTVRTI